MSKIMRQLYAEARAARAAESSPGGSRARAARPVPEPAARAGSAIEWWMAQLARAAERGRAPTGRRQDPQHSFCRPADCGTAFGR